ncbi:YjfA family protein [Streptomyces sp. NBC_00846]|uniref:DUF2690 domain-containing protein n=1 Tax=Streptomyces sp. NBC_00846 TaxID=2975849 RepID=UPI003867D281|nr:YjfA family protein [Streptomyces sp. NBC_00846]
MVRVRITTAVTAMAAVGALVVPSVQAHAAPRSKTEVPAQAQSLAAAGCKGSSCTGKNPHSTKCDQGAKTLDRVKSAGGGPVVQLRVSSKCSAAWAYVPKGFDGFRFKLQVHKGVTYVESASFTRVMYTPMVWSSYRYRACVEHYDGVGGDWACTKWH